jgi:hypothetical protein
MKKPASDEELLRMLREVENAEDVADEVAASADAEDPPFDPCSFCGEPAEHLGTCNVCHEEGCLPADVWSPGMRDPCLTLCVRCARPLHVACAGEDGVGNARCPGCAY